MGLGVRYGVGLLVFGVLCGLGAWGWWYTHQAGSGGHDGAARPFTVVCTTGIIADAVSQIGGDRVAVSALMGPGVDPHVYQARESDVRLLSQADLVLYHGLHLEGKMVQVLDQMAAYKPAYPVAEAVPVDKRIPSGFAGIYDPHVWFDVALWSYVVEYICTLLSRHDPHNASFYQERCRTYRHHLAVLDEYVRDRVASLPPRRRVLVTAHDAFAYFGKAYGCDVVGLQGISTDSDVGTADVVALADMITDRNIPVIFAESSIPRRNIRAVQQAVAARGRRVVVGDTLYSDSLGESGSGAETYWAMVRYNCDAIVDALGGEG